MSTIGSRGVAAQRYTGISGTAVSDLHSSVKYPDQPDYYSTASSFETNGNKYLMHCLMSRMLH